MIYFNDKNAAVKIENRSKYIIVEGDCVSDLQEDVNKAMLYFDYIPQGGILFSKGNYQQVIVR